MKGLVLEFCIWGPLPHVPTLPLQVVPSETSTAALLLLVSFLFLFFQCLLCASGLFKLIQTLPWRFACLFACLVCLHSVLHQLWAFSRLQKDVKKEEGEENATKTRNLSFTVQTICYALCIGYIPSSLIYWFSAGTKWHRDCIGRCVFRFTLVSM